MSTLLTLFMGVFIGFTLGNIVSMQSYRKRLRELEIRLSDKGNE